MSFWYEDCFAQLVVKLTAECERMGDKIPYIAQDGVYRTDMRTENLSWWTNGFWAGMMWQLYHALGRQEFRTEAEKTELWLDQALDHFEGLHHDVGFMWMHTAAANYRITQNAKSRTRALHAATLLAGRYNPMARFLRAWNQEKIGWTIIDTMMNLPLLFFAGSETNDPRFVEIAKQHANTAMNVLLRKDGSCAHIAVLDPHTGAVLETPAGQGYQSGSSWSRGLSWAIYGFALCAQQTAEESYLLAAKGAAHYFIANTAGTGWVSRVDFRAPLQPEMWDTTATACAACALLKLEQLVPEQEKALYHTAAEKMLQALTQRWCNWNCTQDGILQGGTAAYHRQEDTHMPIIYGDYFLVEGLLRLQGKAFEIWGELKHDEF